MYRRLSKPSIVGRETRQVAIVDRRRSWKARGSRRVISQVLERIWYGLVASQMPCSHRMSNIDQARKMRSRIECPRKHCGILSAVPVPPTDKGNSQQFLDGALLAVDREL
ncbi:hypothetical protein LshimejAT787_1205090 [Lyophyllum shimeji]|uniref:Uncharacterized protein n=1 Tax=Lyophyllum shimeji TaxID=47721 RepID=A0A9P3UT00_LYOSH|nr:hypothetical protein LshimejAT787_1205090 [Lyophyllum shimeji]